jgi:hypothetical protein
MHHASNLFYRPDRRSSQTPAARLAAGRGLQKGDRFRSLLPEDPAASLPSRIRRVTRNHSPTCPRTRSPSSLTGTRLPIMRQSSLRNPRDSSPTRGSKSLSSVCALRPCIQSFLEIVLSRRAKRPVGRYRDHRLWQGRHGRKGYDPHVRRHGALLFPCGLRVAKPVIASPVPRATSRSVPLGRSWTCVHFVSLS